MSRNYTRARKFFSYYRPYIGLFSADMACAVIASVAMLAIPLCVRYITANLLQVGSTDALHQIYVMGGIMIGLIAVYAACHAFIDYQGHVMGALMERDMRSDCLITIKSSPSNSMMSIKPASS